MTEFLPDMLSIGLFIWVLVSDWIFRAKLKIQCCSWRGMKSHEMEMKKHGFSRCPLAGCGGGEWMAVSHPSYEVGQLQLWLLYAQVLAACGKAISVVFCQCDPLVGAIQLSEFPSHSFIQVSLLVPRSCLKECNIADCSQSDTFVAMPMHFYCILRLGEMDMPGTVWCVQSIAVLC